jgi:sugar/nucleoside kinase (ribokinase family)
MAEPRLFHIGSAVVDYVYEINRLPMPGEDLLASGFSALPGGGFNMLVAAHRSGLDCAYAGKIGTGPVGALLADAFQVEGIDCIQTRAAGTDTGTCVVLVTADGERTFVSRQGAEALLEADDLRSIASKAGDWFFTSGYTLAYPECRDILTDFIEGLPSNVTFMFDPTGVVDHIPEDILARVMKRADWLTCNRAEATAIVGEAGLEDLAARLLDRSCPHGKGVIIRCGGDGALLALRNEQPVFVPAFRVDVVDTNGAGDVHSGAMAAALARNEPPLNALRIANAAAAISTTRRGGSNAPYRQEVEEFLKRAGETIID